MGIPYPDSRDDARRIIDELDDRLYRAEMMNPAMYMGVDMAKERIVYRDSLPPKIPTNKKLLL